jgi:hypothetical protein
MSGPKRNPDKLNTIGVVVVGVCGAVLVYVTIVALQAYYMNDTSEIQTMADYGGQDTLAQGNKSTELGNLSSAGVTIDQAMKLVVETAQTDPAHTVPMFKDQVDETAKKPARAPVLEDNPPASPPPADMLPKDGAGSGSAGSAAPAAAGSAAAGSGAPAAGSGAPAPAAAAGSASGSGGHAP